MGQLIFVTGGARSGKSSHAETLALQANRGKPVIYLATMQPLDPELVRRVELHRARRPAGWFTVEEPLELAAAVDQVAPDATLLLDCLSLWVSNLFMRAIGHTGMEAAESAPRRIDLEAAAATSLLEAEKLLAIQVLRPGTMVAVSNEVGSGIVPENALARHYRDALGLVNQRAAAASTEAYLLVSGLPLRLK